MDRPSGDQTGPRPVPILRMSEGASTSEATTLQRPAWKSSATYASDSPSSDQVGPYPTAIESACPDAASTMYTPGGFVEKAKRSPSGDQAIPPPLAHRVSASENS